ncbi:hypothetical protein PSCLAVI8L_140034 [Pseudoclavibacter sp. 8L]|nr:hypothetical protein PSCLAVI8L_140034 [Pseudoclavibacter sp. 8L]
MACASDHLGRMMQNALERTPRDQRRAHRDQRQDGEGRRPREGRLLDSANGAGEPPALHEDPR